MKASEGKQNTLTAIQQKSRRKKSRQTSQSGPPLIIFCLMLAYKTCCHAKKKKKNNNNQNALSNRADFYHTTKQLMGIAEFKFVFKYLGSRCCPLLAREASVSVMPLHVCASYVSVF